MITKVLGTPMEDASVEASWKLQALKKRQAQLAQIPQQWRLPSFSGGYPVSTLEYIEQCSILSSREHEITSETSASVLLSRIHGRDLSSVEVVTAFCKRAAIAQQLARCCTEMFFDRAIARAQELDRYLQTNGKVVGPLHGLPVSLKDLMDVEGTDTTIGWVALCDKPATRHGILAELLEKQGAVLYCKTNVSQSLMMSDSYNHVFKQSVNSLNRELISGGSSGGEGALVGCHGSIVGIGTDIGGSIRIPANLQGLYGLCPSVGRVAWDDSVTRDFILNPVAGPITTSLSSMETFMEGLLSASPWMYEPSTYPIPWRGELASRRSRPLRIGYYIDDGLVKVQPPHKRAVNEIVSRLEAAGHTVLDWDTSSHPEAHQLWTQAILADGGSKCEAILAQSGEPLVEGMLVGKESDRLSIQQVEELSRARIEYQKKYLQRWNTCNVDALIMPVQPWVGFCPKTWVQSHQCVSYTGHWNFVDFAALTVPVTTAQPSDTGDEDWLHHVPRNESDRFNWHQYDPELVKGMPVCVQVVGGRFGEENCVAVAKVLEDLLR